MDMDMDMDMDVDMDMDMDIDVYHRPKLERSTRRYIGTALRGALYSLCYLLFVACM